MSSRQPGRGGTSVLVGAVLALAIQLFALASPVSASPIERNLDAVVERAIADGTIVGTVVIVSENGHVIYHRAAGWADREAGRPMREDAIFRLASLTKPIVSAAALSLVETGDLALDDPVTRYLPDFRPRLADGTMPVITVRHLMTHTAGLSYGFLQPRHGPYSRAGVSDGLDQPGLAMAENLRRIGSAPLSYAPGHAWGYSVATDVLGEVVARAAKRPLPEVVASRITAPLRMVDTAFAVRDRSRLTAAYGDGTPPVRMGSLHRVAFGEGFIAFAPERAFDPASFPSGGAGMTGTARDFLVLLETIRTGGGLILSSASAATLATNAIGELPVDAAGPGWGFSLGAAVLKDPARAGSPQSAGTWRWVGAYGHSWFVDPERGLVVVALTNTAISGMVGPFPTAIRDAVYRAARR